MAAPPCAAHRLPKNSVFQQPVKLGICLLLLVVAARAEDQARTIMTEVYHVNHFLSVKNLAYGNRRHPLQVADLPPRGKPRVVRLERHLNNDYPPDHHLRGRDLVIFRSGKLRGTGILVDLPRDPARPLSFAVWLPALRKIRRHAEPDQGDTWAGGIFTYGDMYLRRPDDETHQLLEETTFEGCLGTAGRPLPGAPRASCHPRGRPVWKIRSTTRFPNWWYDYRIVLVDRETFADYRSTYYKNGQAVKVIDKDWRTMGLADPRAQYWRYFWGRRLDTGQEGIAWIDPEGVRWNQKVDPAFWSLATLRRLRR